MNTYKLSNIPVNDFRNFLTFVGCSKVKVEGGHERWIKPGITRPIILQTHISPVPEFIVKNTLRNLGMTKAQFFDCYYKRDR